VLFLEAVYQQSLFNEKHSPEHIKLIPDFISAEEERDLLNNFKTINWQKINMHGVTAKRRVAHFGLDYTYTKRSVTKTIKAPKWLDSLTARAAKLISKKASDLKEILVTYYPKGSGIGWHKDAEVFGDAVIGVSLLSDCTMKFKNLETQEVYKLFIPRRSAYIFSGDARWNWHHSISSHEHDRYSVTFRTLVNDSIE
jgi:alkylated DNA repair dioxygenase AlkB